MKRTRPSSVEKLFVHDMASQLMLAMGWLERLSATKPDVKEELEYKKLDSQLKKIGALLSERRERILAQDEDPD